jgi:hypothetical protein
MFLLKNGYLDFLLQISAPFKFESVHLTKTCIRSLLVEIRELVSNWGLLKSESKSTFS